jgi:hypothetical protein
MHPIRKQILIAAVSAIAPAALVAGAAADPITWQVQASFSSSGGVNSVRGLALSPDGSQEYLGFIQSGASRSVEEYATDSTFGSPASPISAGTGATASTTLNSDQPKGVAVDNQGNVYATLNSGANSSTQGFGIYSSSLTSLGSASVSLPSSSQIGGIAVQNVGGTNYAYVSSNKGTGVIERYNVSNPAAPVLDTSWAKNGVLNLTTLGFSITNGSPALNGLEVAPNGTIYATAAVVNPNVNRGDSVLEISADGSTLLNQNNSVTEAMDLTLFGGNVYVADYNGGSSAITVLNASDLSLNSAATAQLNAGLAAINLGSTAAGSDDGFAGITVNSAGQLFVTDEAYGSGLDQVLVSSPVPEPATIGVFIVGASALLLRRRRRLSASE